ncbi:MAG: hypothetical protein GWN00_00140, partial [Aliifodinibius sp.]|nr:hypothetical protein [Phycisphaerae bacterium]NIT54692.1 hypothetical protein [Fodinibius sp.]NIS49615.1 hypothetical protein [Phycisphaerae bacterium]NIV09750.1 hypothetical protein [Fodinibius sp.]NIW96762.1 hypothetical protein [Phycisphaerae bacterium]
MRKFKVVLVAVFILFATITIAKEFQDYFDLSGDIADGDTFLIRNLDDTTDDAVYGSVNEVTWGKLRE